jgi:hypothetical protein
MFKITDNPTFTHTVQVQVPVDGGFETQSLKVRYRALGMERLEQLEPTGDNASQRAYCEAIVESFDDLVDDKGKPVVCDANLYAKLLDRTYVRRAVMQEYLAAMSGAKTKN